MKNMKKVLIFLTVIAIAVSMCAGLAGCGNTDGNGPDGGKETGASSGANVNYTVTVKSAGGMALQGISVSIFTDEGLTNLQNTMQTNESGVASLSMPEGGQYYISLSGVPKGYALEPYYTFSGTTANITLSSSLVQGENLAAATLDVGSVMYDFTVTAPDGTEHTLSEMMKDKKMALINFWYTGCSWCITEFPFMEEAYQIYIDDVAIVALDPMNESNEAIAAFPAANGLNLTFPLASCPVGWANTFAIEGYPTSVIVDRYGVIVMIESGAITSLRAFSCLFETLTADDYEQKLYTSIGEVVTKVKPTYEMADSETVSGILGTSELDISFHGAEGEGTEYAWPFIEAEKNGEKCLKASNTGIDESYAMLYADVTLKAGQVLCFDYITSSESSNDFMPVIVDGDDIYRISGYNEVEKWETCYPIVADKDGTYELVLSYIKDESDAAGDDTVYIKNMRIVDAAGIDTPTYLPRQAATTEDGVTYNYAELVFNEKDGYYHVGTMDGPLLLADLMNTTHLDEEDYIWNMAYEGKIVVDGVDYAERLEVYSNYANNSNLYGICPVNQELYELMQMVDKAVGFDDADDMEWLKACKYYQVYGTNEPLENPIKGLTPSAAYTAKLGKNVESNSFYYNRPIMPRGLMAEFIPSKSGVYRITSRNEALMGVEGWIFNADKEILMTYEPDERMFGDPLEVSMVYYMEAGTPYYIDIAFRDLYEVGYVYYDIEFLGSSYSHFRSCSPGPFTFSTDETGSAMNYTIAPGIDVVLGSDGYYYHDLGNGKKGSMIYADFTGVTDTINFPISSVDDVKGLIDQGAFDFTKTEDDGFILKVLEINDNDQAKAIEYLKTSWGDEYETNYQLYAVDEVFEGIYHGTGEDYTELMRKYEKNIITSGSEERIGCVPVTEELAEALQKLMDKYTFEGVDTSWRKLSYYYDYMG